MFSILVGNKVVAQTPRHFGVNVEVQEHYDRCNLWDWLVDSGASVIREFHPEKYLRKEPLTPKQLEGIRTKADFDQWRQRPYGGRLFKRPVIGMRMKHRGIIVVYARKRGRHDPREHGIDKFEHAAA